MNYELLMKNVDVTISKCAYKVFEKYARKYCDGYLPTLVIQFYDDECEVIPLKNVDIFIKKNQTKLKITD